MTVENWQRSLRLQLTTLRIGMDRLRGILNAKALIEQLPDLAKKAAGSPEAERTVQSIRAELEASLSAELESQRLGEKSTLDLERLDDVLEGKALRDANGPWQSEKRRDFVRFIRRIGGYSADGLPTVDPLDFDAPHFERAAQLIRGEAAPDSAAERKALAGWSAKYGEAATA
jgi:hypothetical protein